MRGFLVLLAVVLAFPAAQLRAGDDLVGLERIIAAWLESPHGDYHSRSFTYWNADGEVPTSCATCHSETGMLDFLGVGGLTPGEIDHPGAINSPIGCASCHTEEGHALDAVTFPSGVEATGLGASATCMVCHQGRQSNDQVAARVDGKALDEVSDELSFVNIHYGASAAVMYGAAARGGVQYDGRSYVGQFMHVPAANTCSDCHNPHSTEVEPASCLACHTEGADDLRDIRVQHVDFAATGDRAGGIHTEIEAFRDALFDAIRRYADEVVGEPIAYGGGFPYFFASPDGTGTMPDDMLSRDNRYQHWTPRLLKAAYNYQVARLNPGAYAHNPRYMMQLLHDSLHSLSEAIDIDMTGMIRP